MFWRPRFLKNQEGLPGFLMFDPKRNTVSYMFLRLWTSHKSKILPRDFMFVYSSILKIHDVRAHVCVRLNQVALLEYEYFPISRAVCSSSHLICTSLLSKCFPWTINVLRCSVSVHSKSYRRQEHVCRPFDPGTSYIQKSSFFQNYVPYARSLLNIEIILAVVACVRLDCRVCDMNTTRSSRHLSSPSYLSALLYSQKESGSGGCSVLLFRLSENVISAITCLPLSIAVHSKLLHTTTMFLLSASHSVKIVRFKYMVCVYFRDVACEV
jgi:hypothetical protein